MKKTLLISTIFFCVFTLNASATKKVKQNAGIQDRAIWVKTLTHIADPVLTNLANETLRKNMPYQSLRKENLDVCYLEAVGRLVAGIAPWLELGPDETAEGKLRAKYIQLTLKGLKNAVNPASPDYLVFDKRTNSSQPLVDAAFLAQGLLRAPKQIWGNLDNQAKEWMISEFKRSRCIVPGMNNWVLFASTVEAALLEFTGECDMDRLILGVNKHQEWYKGDGVYGDGPTFHMDYYNSFVIHPMLNDVLAVMKKHQVKGAEFYETELKRSSRYAEQQERLISPEGAFPVVGRSMAYLTGAFHALAQAALMRNLAENLQPAQVRCAMTAVIQRIFNDNSNFDRNGWLRVGFVGDQLNISEKYINTGSIYLCSVGFLPLGLPITDDFWSAPFTEWTNLRAWTGMEVKADHANK